MEKFFLTKLKETNHLGDSSHFLTEPWCWEDECFFLLLCLVVFSSSKWFWPPFKMFWLQYVLNMMNKNPMCFCLFVPRNSWSKLSLSASGGFRSRGFPSRSREYIVSFAFSEGRYIRHPSSRKTLRVFFFWENEPKGKQSSWEINSRIQLSWLWEEEYNKTLLARQCWKDNVRRHGSSCRSVFVNRRLCQFGQKDAKVLTDYRFQVQYFWWKKSG